MTFATASLLAWQSVQAASGLILPPPPQDVTARFELPPPAPGEAAWEVTLAADFPQLANPTNLDVDADGRAWVTEALRYRGIPDRDPAALRRERGDRVVILTDRDGDGRYDESKVFVEDPDLLAPLGIAVLGPPGGPREVYVSCSPAIYRYVDADGDDVPERRETFLTGFGGRDHDHGVHAVVQGPDGALWFNAGNQGPHAVTDPDGRVLLRAGSFVDGGAVGESEVPSFVGGLALRFDRASGSLACVGHNFRNCYEIAVDSFGDVWQNDNDDDGNQGCRIAWVMPGANHGYASADGRRSWQADRRPGQSTAVAQWHQDDPGVAPSGAITGAGGPTGIVRYEGRALGAAFDGALFSCDAGRSLIWSCVPQVQGAGFALAPTPFLAPRADDPERSLFRPSDVAIDHDGSLLIADWWDPMVGGHGMLDRQGGGRLLRVRRKGSVAVRTERPDLSSPEGALAALDSPVVHVRAAAFDALTREPLAKALDVAAIERAIDELGPTAAAARRLWVLSRLGSQAREVVRRWRDAATADLRVLVAIRAIRADWSSGSGVAVALRLAAVGSPALRREVLLAMRRAPLLHRREVVVQLARALDPTDRFELEAFGSFCTGIEEAVWPDLMAALGDVPMKWSERFAAIAWRLHPRAALDALVVRARSGELRAADRRQALDALAFVPDPERVADALFELLRHGPDDVRPLAAAWLSQRGGLSLARGAAAWQSEVLHGRQPKSSLREVDVELRGAQTLWLVVDDGGDGHSHDWADWLEPTLHGPVRVDGTRESVRLTTLAPLVATVGWGSLGIDRNAGGGPLQVESQPHAWGFGVHAASELAFLLPPGRFERFTAKVAPDDGGVDQPGARTSLRFAVHLGSAPDGATTADGVAADPAAVAARARLLADRDRLRDGATPRAERLRLVRTLAERPEAGLLLIELAAAGALDAELREAAAPGLLRHPELAVRALASESFPRLAADGSTLPSDAELLKITGDVTRGRDLFFSDRVGCAKCHGHGERGGDVGPALSVIGAKYDRAALLDALVHPSAAIAFGYEPWLVTLRSGDVVTGFLLADGDPLILKEASGARRTIAAAEIQSKRRSKL